MTNKCPYCGYEYDNYGCHSFIDHLKDEIEKRDEKIAELEYKSRSIDYQNLNVFHAEMESRN